MDACELKFMIINYKTQPRAMFDGVVETLGCAFRDQSFALVRDC